ncbi:MAG: C4-dicarboxylate ABC transporter substrate-binding protein [Deltaproteobacteria bacterium]|nr:MAG: C4-dicarboxylate ABC transporter substrate-binding protein [Deltaproteobacteria bacterium]
MKRLLLLLTLFVSFTLIFYSCSKKDEGKTETKKSETIFATIGTGGLTGVYYPTGGAIAKIVNKKKNEYKIRCTVESTGGSVYNINAVLAGDLEFGIAQSDRIYQAKEGLAEWKTRGKQEELRTVFSIHPESVTLVVADDAGIEDIKDLKGKRVNIGNPGSGQRQNAIDAFTTVGIDTEKDIITEGVKAAEAAGLLQDNRIDAYFYTVGHPNGSVKEATSGKRPVRFASITDIDKLLKKYPYYAKSIIPIEFYPNIKNKEDAVTFGVKATLITSSKVPEDVVYAITKEVFENLDSFKKLHPAYKVLTRKNMIEGLAAPLHKGAIKYYKEAGLM